MGVITTDRAIYIALRSWANACYTIERVHVLSGLWRLTETCGKNLWTRIALHTKCGVTRSYLVVYYPCCGDVDIDQLETYGY